MDEWNDHITNVRKGARSGVVPKLIRSECPHVLVVGCICHLADLTLRSGMQSLPIKFLLMYCISTTRKQEYCNLLPQLSHRLCPTRWLCLLHCVGRHIDQFDGLKSYFLVVNPEIYPKYYLSALCRMSRLVRMYAKPY